MKGGFQGPGVGNLGTHKPRKGTRSLSVLRGCRLERLRVDTDCGIHLENNPDFGITKPTTQRTFPTVTSFITKAHLGQRISVATEDSFESYHSRANPRQSNPRHLTLRAIVHFCSLPVSNTSNNEHTHFLFLVLGSITRFRSVKHMPPRDSCHCIAP